MEGKLQRPITILQNLKNSIKAEKKNLLYKWQQRNEGQVFKTAIIYLPGGKLGED